MASFLDKFKVKTAIEKNTTLDLSCQHITTANWMELSPVYIKEMVPGESIEVTQSTFTRMAPLAVPTLGRGLIHNRAFFVPMRTIFDRWDEFITQSKSGMATQAQGSGNPVALTSVPSFTNSALVHMFLGTGTTYTIPTDDTENRNTQFVTAIPLTDNIDNADIVASIIPANATQSSSIVTMGYNFTPFGRQVMKILQSLGYNIVWADTYNGQAAASALVNYRPSVSYSALPLLAFFKIFIDWYWPAQYVGTTGYNFVESVLKYNGYSSATSTGSVLTPSTLYFLFTLGNQYTQRFSVNYDSSYLVSAFDQPVTPNGANSAINYINDQTLSEEINNGELVSNVGLQGTENTPGVISYQPQDDNQPGPITQFALNALRAMTDYMQRHNLVGVRALDRFYARFGISLGSEKLKRSNYIGAQNIPLQIGDVMSNSDTEGAKLGAYAGKGLGYGQDSFSFKSEDYGFFVICSSIVPIADTYEGVNRMVLHRSPLDFWTPEYDQLGNQAISKMEVYVPMNDSQYADGTPVTDFNNQDLVTGIFGWTPRYSEYKVGRDIITGDFRYKSLSNVGETSDAWFLNRNLDSVFRGSDDMVHSQYFVNAQDSDQYNRIFAVESDENDKFYLIHNFNVVSNSPMHSLYDSYEFDSNGKTVVADVNGVKVN